MRTAALLLCLAGSATAQTVPETTPDPALAAQFARTGEIVQNIRQWRVDIDGDATPDRFLQVGYTSASGGNAFWLRFFVLPAEGRTGGTLEVSLDTAGIESVQMGPGGPVAITTHRGPDDPNCCPSIRRFTSIKLEDLPPA